MTGGGFGGCAIVLAAADRAAAAEKAVADGFERPLRPPLPHLRHPSGRGGRGGGGGLAARWGIVAQPPSAGRTQENP